MELATALAFVIAILGALLSPGPALLSLTRSALGSGRAAGIRTGLGLSAAATTWSFTAFAGLTTLFAVVPAAYLVLKLLGAAYLLWLAWTLWRDAKKPVDTEPRRGLKGFTLGFVTNIANPKAVFFIAAILATILPPDMTLAGKAQLLALHFATEAAFYTACALTLTTPPARAAYIRLKATWDRCAAVVLGALALRMTA